MASVVFNSFFDDLARGKIDLSAVSVKVLLVTAAYAEDKDNHAKRADVTSEVSGTGYIAGGKSVAVTLTKDTLNDRLVIGLGSVSWASSAISARKAIYYVARGGAASADELIAVDDFGADVVSANGGTFTLGSSSVTLQN